jgi:hypothetical protein
MEKQGLKDWSQYYLPCLSFPADCQGWRQEVTYLPPDFFQWFLTGCSDMCLSVLITCDVGLARLLTKFKSTIIKQKGNRKDASNILPISLLPCSVTVTKIHLLCSVYGHLRYQAYSICLGQPTLHLLSH